jgi:hypothetical protein
MLTTIVWKIVIFNRKGGKVLCNWNTLLRGRGGNLGLDGLITLTNCGQAGETQERYKHVS